MKFVNMVAGDSNEICLIFLVVIINFHPGIKHIIIVVITDNCDIVILEW